MNKAEATQRLQELQAEIKLLLEVAGYAPADAEEARKGCFMCDIARFPEETAGKHNASVAHCERALARSLGPADTAALSAKLEAAKEREANG